MGEKNGGGWEVRGWEVLHVHASLAVQWVLLLLTFPLLLGEPLPRLLAHPDGLQEPPENIPPAPATGHTSLQSDPHWGSPALRVPAVPAARIQCLQGRQVARLGMSQCPLSLFDQDTPCLHIEQREMVCISRKKYVISFFLETGGPLGLSLVFFTLN